MILKNAFYAGVSKDQIESSSNQEIVPIFEEEGPLGFPKPQNNKVTDIHDIQPELLSFYFCLLSKVTKPLSILVNTMDKVTVLARHWFDQPLLIGWTTGAKPRLQAASACKSMSFSSDLSTLSD